MAIPPQILVDGRYFQPEEVGSRRFTYPFRQNGDLVSCFFDVDFWQRDANYVPAAFSTTHPELTDFYLTQESQPISMQANVSVFTRRYARIPSAQTSYSSMAITKPVFPNQSAGVITIAKQNNPNTAPAGIGAGAYYGIGGVYVISPGNMVYGPFKTGTLPTKTAASSGQFRVKYKTSTTANLNYNDGNATINAAINGLAAVIADGITVSVNNLFTNATFCFLDITLSVGSTTSLFYVDANSFNAASNTLFTAFLNSAEQQIAIGSRTTISSHGFDATLDLAMGKSTLASADNQVDILNPQNVSLTQGSWAVVDANTIAFDRLLSDDTDTLFGQFLRTYTPGPDRVGIRLYQTFYLPGVTPGIATAAAIPIPAPLINDADFLAAVLTTPNGYLNYDADPLVFWDGTTNIYTQTQKQINMADV